MDTAGAAQGQWWPWELQVLLSPEMTVMVALITLNFATYMPAILALPTVAGGEVGSSRSGVLNKCLRENTGILKHTL